MQECCNQPVICIPCSAGEQRPHPFDTDSAASWSQGECQRCNRLNSSTQVLQNALGHALFEASQSAKHEQLFAQ